MHKSDILGSNTNNIYNSDRVPLIHLDQLPKILICKLMQMVKQKNDFRKKSKVRNGILSFQKHPLEEQIIL